MRRILARRTRNERGVVAILVAVMALLILMFAAYAVDIGMLVNKKHQLNDTLDAAAQAGAYELPGSSVDARAKALAFAAAHDPSETGALAPNVDFWCVVASKLTAGTYQPDVTQIPATCNPGTAPYTAPLAYKMTGRLVSCSVILCAIPCDEPTPNNATPKIACNTIRVFQGRDVPFAFAPAGGFTKGNTGNIISVACKGSCGTVAPNPMDVAIVADRTGSMTAPNLADMIQGIKETLKQMTPSQQYVALGTIGRSDRASTPTSEPGGACAGPSGGANGSTKTATSATTGAWLPVPFSDNYLNGPGTNTNGNSALVKGINCLNVKSGTGTTLAAPMKAAARYLLGLAPNNLSSLPTREDPVTKVLIFETDGQPNEEGNTGGQTALSSAPDVFSKNDHLTTLTNKIGPTTTGPATTTKSRITGSGSTKKTWTDTYKLTSTITTTTDNNTVDGGQTACANLDAVATNAKAAGILVITIAYNLGLDSNGNEVRCGNSNSPSSTPNNTSVMNGATVITSITPGAAQNINGQGVKSLITSYKGNATINQTYTKTTTNTNWAWAPDLPVRSVLAGAASPTSTGASTSNNDCSTSAMRDNENADGDYFFCAATGTDMATIFTTALSQVSKGIKLIKMP